MLLFVLVVLAVSALVAGLIAIGLLILLRGFRRIAGFRLTILALLGFFTFLVLLLTFLVLLFLLLLIE